MQSDGGEEREREESRGEQRRSRDATHWEKQHRLKVKGSCCRAAHALALLHMIYNQRLITKHNFL
jgi:hypothetical protein